MHIPAILAHPEIMGPPLERGVRYGHHFVVELISDGKRLWAVSSEEGRKVLNEIAHGLTGDEAEVKRGPTITEWIEAGYSAKHYPPAPYASCSTDEEIAAAVEAERQADAAKMLGNQSGSGTEPLPNPSGTGGEPPTTTVSPGNTFG